MGALHLPTRTSTSPPPWLPGGLRVVLLGRRGWLEQVECVLLSQPDGSANHALEESMYPVSDVLFPRWSLDLLRRG